LDAAVAKLTAEAGTIPGLDCLSTYTVGDVETTGTCTFAVTGSTFIFTNTQAGVTLPATGTSFTVNSIKITDAAADAYNVTNCVITIDGTTDAQATFALATAKGLAVAATTTRTLTSSFENKVNFFSTARGSLNINFKYNEDLAASSTIDFDMGFAIGEGVTCSVYTGVGEPLTYSPLFSDCDYAGQKFTVTAGSAIPKDGDYVIVINNYVFPAFTATSKPVGVVKYNGQVLYTQVDTFLTAVSTTDAAVPVAFTAFTFTKEGQSLQYTDGTH